MMNRSLMQRLARWLAVAVLLGAGLGAGLGAMAQAEPTLKQIYDAAQAGRLEQAQTMIQQVLVLHPKSAKAHFVQAELAARQGQIARAREALAEAEKLAPGLPFAKPEAVQSLRAALVAQPATAVKPGAIAQTPQAAPFAVSTAPAPASSSQMGLGLDGGQWFERRRPPCSEPGARARRRHRGRRRWSPRIALRTAAARRRALSLGFARYWLAEHHNMAGIASSATAVLVGHIAGGTWPSASAWARAA
jgi:tetratricopeptide (TPR) repeat protein